MFGCKTKCHIWSYMSLPDSLWRKKNFNRYQAFVKIWYRRIVIVWSRNNKSASLIISVNALVTIKIIFQMCFTLSTQCYWKVQCSVFHAKMANLRITAERELSDSSKSRSGFGDHESNRREMFLAENKSNARFFGRFLFW